MENYVLLTDSTADLPYSVYCDLEIEVVPMEYIMDDKVYTHYADAREISAEEFYKNIRAGKKSSTSQINSYTYECIFKKILEQGKDIVYIGFTSGLSGTYHASTLVAESMREKFPERKIIVIDSLCASIGEGILVYQAAMRKKQGMALEELVAWVEDNKRKVCHWFIVDDLDHLKQGGRISAVQAALGTALNLKPMLSVDGEGKLVCVSKIRGSKKVISAFISKITETSSAKEQTVIIGHADNKEGALLLEEQLKELGLVKAVIISDIGPVIGTHVGAGMLALVFMGER